MACSSPDDTREKGRGVAPSSQPSSRTSATADIEPFMVTCAPSKGRREGETESRRKAGKGAGGEETAGCWREK